MNFLLFFFSTGISLTPIAFSSTTSNDFQTKLATEPVASTDPDELIKKYSLEKCCQWINDNNFQRVRLNSNMCWSTLVSFVYFLLLT